MKSTRIDLSGKRFGLLKVISYSHSDRQNCPFYICRCSCGKEKTIKGKYLKNGDTKSCGCLREISGNKNLRFTGYKEIHGKFFSRIVRSAKSRKLEFNITIQQVWDLFLKQNRKCSFSGMLLNFQSNTHLYDGTASLDRIDSNKGYTIDNVQWVHKKVNMMKKEMSDSEFITWCREISGYRKEK